MNKENLGSNLQYLMKIHGSLSVSELAREFHIPQPTLHHILTGTTKKPRKEALKALAKFFSVSIAQLTGALPLLPVIPDTIKDNLKITTVPIIEWEMVKTWPLIESKTLPLKEIILDRKIDKNAFALVMQDATMEPLFPEKSILIFDPSKKPKDREFTITQLLQNDAIVFNRLFIDGLEYFIKQNQSDGNTQLTKLTSRDKIVATLIEVRWQF